MYPNPQGALPLPSRPSLEQYRKRAKELLWLCHAGDQQALHNWIRQWIESLVRLAGLEITSQMPVRVDHWVDQFEEFARTRCCSSTGGGSLTDAQFVIARAHGFESWPKLAKHLQAFEGGGSLVSDFLKAADAIVAGDAAALKMLLQTNPALARARSTREHNATLLHYVSANGVEGFRQKTPGNAVEIVDMLLSAGVDANALADVYGGHTTTLELVATSVHPERAGVQNELMQLLLDRGAVIDGGKDSIINSCLFNGRIRAADFLAAHGARMDFAAASALGRLDIVKEKFAKEDASPSETERAFLWACQYGHNEVIEFLLSRDQKLLQTAYEGQTALHSAILGGQSRTVELLLRKGASLTTKNVYGGTALDQAVWSATHTDSGLDYLSIIDLLVKAGSQMDSETATWFAKYRDGMAKKSRQ